MATGVFHAKFLFCEKDKSTIKLKVHSQISLGQWRKRTGTPKTLRTLRDDQPRYPPRASCPDSTRAATVCNFILLADKPDRLWFHRMLIMGRPNRIADPNTSRDLLSGHWLTFIGGPWLLGTARCWKGSCASGQPMSHTSRSVKYFPSNHGPPVPFIRP